jgi:hypothetical protein
LELYSKDQAASSKECCFVVGDVQGIWSLRESWDQPHHKYLVLAFVGETRVLAMNQVRSGVYWFVVLCLET